MVLRTHKKLQNYKRHYGSTCITGLLGCRWHRYQQSTSDTTKLGRAWYSVLVGTTLFILFMLYYWIIAANSSDDFSWHLYDMWTKWWPIYTIVLSLTCVAFTYITLLFLLSLCHVAMGHQVYIHWLNKIVMIATIAGCITALVITTDLWGEGWKLQYISLLITGPWLHMCSVFIMTVLTWFVAEGSLSLQDKWRRGVWLSVYITIMLILYIIPVFIVSPCICELADVPSKPLLFAHRGASAIAPENTMAAFNESLNYDLLYALETDVTVSYDGVPFLMHDRRLSRTTNVRDVFPDRADDCACMFNSSELAQLNAGSWFLDLDPFKTVSSLSSDKVHQYKDLSIPTLDQLLDLVQSADTKLLLDIVPYETGIPDVHPYAHTYTDVIINTLVNRKSVPQHNIYWQYSGILNTSIHHNFTIIYGKGESDEELLHRSSISINIPFQRATLNSVRSFQNENQSINIWTVNSEWLYSVYWCMDVDSVTTNYVHTLSNIEKPVWHLTPSEFRVMWIVTDVASLVLVVVIFILQRLRKGVPKKYTPEVVTLQSARQRITNKHHNSRYMKEKLIVDGEGLQEMEICGGIVGDSDFIRYSYGSSIGLDKSIDGGSVFAANPLAESNQYVNGSFEQVVDNFPDNNRFSGISGLSAISGISSVNMEPLTTNTSTNEDFVNPLTVHNTDVYHSAHTSINNTGQVAHHEVVSFNKVDGSCQVGESVKEGLDRIAVNSVIGYGTMVSSLPGGGGGNSISSGEIPRGDSGIGETGSPIPGGGADVRKPGNIDVA